MTPARMRPVVPWPAADTWRLCGDAGTPRAPAFHAAPLPAAANALSLPRRRLATEAARDYLEGLGFLPDFDRLMVRARAGLPPADMTLRTFAEMRRWAAQHGLDFYPDRLLPRGYTEDDWSSEWLRSSGYQAKLDQDPNDEAWLPDYGYAQPLHDFVYGPRRGVTVSPLGVRPVAYYQRVETVMPRFRYGPGPRSGETGSPVLWGRGPRNYHASRTYWWGVDARGMAVTSAAADDVVLVYGRRDGVEVRGRRDESRWLGGFVRPCVLAGSARGDAVPARVRPTSLTLPHPSLDTTVVALSGYYPPPVPARFEDMGELVEAHARGELALTGARSDAAFKAGDVTAVRVWPVQSTGGDPEPVAFYYVGRRVVGACPLRFYAMLAEEPSSEDVRRCNPPPSGGAGLADLLMGFVAGAASFVSPAFGQAARVMASAVAQGGKRRALGAAINAAPEVARLTGGALAGASDYLADALGALTAGFPLADAARIGSGPVKHAFEQAVAQRSPVAPGLGNVSTAAQAAMAVAGRYGIPPDVAARVVGTKVSELTVFAERTVAPNARPREWMEAARLYVTAAGDQVGSSTDSAYDFVQAVRAGGTHPLARDPSVLASALEFVRDGRYTAFALDSRAATRGLPRLLEEMALTHAAEHSAAAREAMNRAGIGPLSVEASARAQAASAQIASVVRQETGAGPAAAAAAAIIAAAVALS